MVAFNLTKNLFSNCCTLHFVESCVAVMDKDGSTVRYASIFAKKYGTLVRYAFFVLVRVRYAFCVMVRVRYVATLFEFQNLPTKRFMCKVRPSMKIRATVPDVHIV